MATKNLVPRTGSQGQLGTDAKPWKHHIADSGSFELISGSLTPDADGTYDLGSSTKEWNNLYIDGTANIDSLTLSSGATVTAVLDEDAMGSDSATSLATQQSIKKYVDDTVTAEDLDVSSDSGTIAIDLDSETFTIAGGTGITTSATSNTLTITSAITAGDGLTLNTADIDIDAAQTTITSLFATDIKIGEDDETKIDFEDANTINFYTGNEKQLILTDGALTPGSNAIVDLGTDALEFKDAYFDGTVEADAITIAGVTLSETIADTVGAMVSSNTETNIAVTYEDSDNTLDFVIGTLNQDTTGTADNITVSANNSTDETVYPIFVDGTTGSQGAESDTGLTYNPSSGDLTIGGELVAATLDISGNVDIDGTLEADAITVDSTTLAEYIADTIGAMVTSNTESDIDVTYDDSDNTLDFVVANISGTAGLATSLTVSANNSTDETVYPLFVDGATGTQGAETDTGLTYNPSTGVLTGTQFTGNVNGNLTGTLQTAAQTNVTSLGTLTALTVDNVAIDGAVIGHTSDTDLITLSSGVVTVAGEVDATSLDISGDADIDGTLEADAITIAGVTLSETIADTVGAMVSSNTESDISVTYEDGDNTLDFDIDDVYIRNDGNDTSSGTITAAGFTSTATGSIAHIKASDEISGSISQAIQTGITTAANLTTVGTIGSGTWEGTTVAVAQGGTGATTLNDLITLSTHTTGNYVGTITGGTGITSTGATTGEGIAHSLSVDASQTQITSVGTIGTGTWEGTTIAVDQGGTGVTTSTGTTNVVLSNSPTLVTPALGTPSALVGTNISGTASSLNIGGTAAIGTSITVTANNSADETVYPLFVDGVSGTQGAETDSGLTYNPSTGLLTSTGFSGNLTGTLQTASQTNITSIGTIQTGVWNSTDIGVAYGGTGASNASDARDNLGLTIGSNVQAYDAQLASVAGWSAAQVTTLGNIGTTTTAADKMIYTTAADTFAETAITSFGRSLVDDAAASNARTTLGLGTSAVLNTAAISDGGSGVATADQIHTFVTTQTDSIAANTSGTATTVTVTDDTSNNNWPIVLHDGSNGLLDDTGTFTYNPSTSTLVVPNISVSGTQTFIDTATLVVTSSVIFEGATDDGYETTLTVTDPTADRTWTLQNASDTIVGRDTSDTLTNKTISGASNTLSNIANSSLSNSTISGVALGSNLNDLTVDNTTVQLNSGTTFNASAARTISAKTAAISDGGSGLATADQIHTFVTSQTDGIVADTMGNAATITITDNESTNEENAILFSAGADTDGGNLGVEQDHSGMTYNPSTGEITANRFNGDVTGDVTGDLEGTILTASQTNITAVGTIATGVWNGDAISTTYLSGQSGTNTGDETKTRINALDITEVGTISSGVWQGTAINQTYLVGQSGTNTGDTSISDSTSNTSSTVRASETAVKAAYDRGSTGVTNAAAAQSTADSAVQPGDTFYIGTTSIAHNRGSGGLTLAGITLTTPDLGTPSALVLTNATALPAAQVSQGTMASGMVLVAPALGTPASGVLTNCTALPAAQVSQGTMASGMVLVAPALGTPASGVMTNVTGTASGLTAGNATLAATVTVTDSTADTDFAIPFHDGSNALLDDTGTFTYNPSTATLSATSASFNYVSSSVVEVDATTLKIGGTSITKDIADGIQNVTGTNTGDVTLSGTPDYITISNQVITQNAIDLTADVTGLLPDGNLSANTAHLDTTQTFSGAKSFTLAVNIDATTTSTSKTTGALIVDGGVGIAENVHAGGDVVAYASSDERLKDNLISISNPLDKIGKIGGYTFDWNDKQSIYKGHDVGVVAQEIQEVLPEVVEERESGYLAVKYEKIVPLLIEAIKEQQKQIDELRKTKMNKRMKD